MFEGIPVINLNIADGAYIPDHAEKLHAELATQIVDAAKKFGFFQVSGHGITSMELSNLLDETRNFFDQSDIVKNAVRLNDCHRGYIGYGHMRMRGSKYADVKESFIFGMSNTHKSINPEKSTLLNNWPSYKDRMKTVCSDVLSKANAVGRFMLSLLAMGLKIPEDTFIKEFNPPMTRGSLIHYPCVRNIVRSQHGIINSEHYGVAPHTDYGCITLVCQHGVGGLEVNINDQWCPVEPLEGVLVVNIGDLLARWVNGYIKSTVHRVISQDSVDRYSFAVFIDPSPEATIGCIAIDNSPLRYQPVIAKNYIQSRLIESRY